MNADTFDDPALPELVSAAMEALDQGRGPQLEVICRDRPDLIWAVAQSLETAGRLAAMQREAASFDGLRGRMLDARYRLDERLGAGAMGVVYRAEDLVLKREVAVKILRPGILGAGEAERRFARESEVLAAVRHPSVVTIHDRGVADEDGPYLVMELLEGLSLGELVDRATALESSSRTQQKGWLEQALSPDAVREPSSLRTLVRWASELADGLEAAHRAGVFHRDVKPSNVFVKRDGQPLLLDFGIAALESRVTITREGAPLGTPAYMAPESLQPVSVPGPEVDVYGLTATLYHALTLTAPYRGTPTQILAALAKDDPVPAGRLDPGLPRDLQAILDKGMARDVGQRYGTAGELASDLRAFLDHRPVQARPVTPLTRLARRLRRSTAFRAAALVTLVGLVAVLGFVRRSEVLAGRRAESAELRRGLPPNLSIVGYGNRATTSAAERDELFERLDRMVELAEAPLPARLLRAAARLDHGDARGAARDMQVLGRSLATPYARSLAAAYGALSDEAASAGELRLDGLPDPQTAQDVYLAAFHRARDLDYAGAHELLARLREDSVAKPSVSASELYLATLPGTFKGLDDGELERRAYTMLEGARELEERIGTPTATTAHLRTTALLRLERYEDAYRVARAGLELASRSHTLSNNAALAAWRTGRIDEGIALAEATIELRPDFYPPHFTLIHCHLWRGDLAASEAVIERAPFPTGVAGERRKLGLLAAVETERAALLWNEGLEQDARAAAGRALAIYAELGLTRREPPPAEVTINQALAEGDAEAAFSGLAQLAAKHPLRWRRLATAARWMPDSLTEDEANAARSLLLEVSRAIERNSPEQQHSGDE